MGRKSKMKVPDIPLLPEDYEAHWNVTSFKDKVILDIGADWGTTAIFFLKKGAKKIIAVEPADPRIGHFAKLEEYWKDYPEILIPISCEIPDTPQNFEKYIRDYKPDIVKIDCEGCEKALLSVDKKLIEMVPEYLIEIHKGWLHPDKNQNDALQYEFWGNELHDSFLMLFKSLKYECKTFYEREAAVVLYAKRNY